MKYKRKGNTKFIIIQRIYDSHFIICKKKVQEIKEFFIKSIPIVFLFFYFLKGNNFFLSDKNETKAHGTTELYNEQKNLRIRIRKRRKE